MTHKSRKIILLSEPVSAVTEPDIKIIGIFDNSQGADDALFRELLARAMAEEKIKKK